MVLIFTGIMAVIHERVFGLEKGHKVTKLEKKERHSRRRGVSTNLGYL